MSRGSISDLASDAQCFVSGEYHRAHHGAACPARLTRRGETIQISSATDGAALVSAPISAIDISAQIGTIPRRIVCADGSVFVTADNETVNRLLVDAAGPGLIHRLERFHPRLIAFVVAAALLMAGVYRYGVPAFLHVAVSLTPASVPATIGSSTLSTLDRSVFSQSNLDEAERQVVEDGFRRLGKHADADRLTLLFRDGGNIGPNALALPDGTIILTDQLVELAQSNDQILGVLAHEIGHVEQHHSLKQLYHGLSIAAVIMLVGGDVGDLTESVLFQGSAVLALSYSRAQELEADRRSVELMSAIGGRSDALAGLLRQLQKACAECDEVGFLSTHPGHEERIATINRLAARTIAHD